MACVLRRILSLFVGGSTSITPDPLMKTTSGTLAAFEHLPPELILSIIKYLQPPPLYALVCASPRAWDVFQSNPAKIMRLVSVTPYGKRCPFHYLRAWAVCRLLQDEGASGPNKDLKIPASALELAFWELLPPARVLEVARDAMRQAYLVERLENGVLATLLGRAHALRPQHLADRSFTFQAAPGFGAQAMDSVLGQFPAGEPFVPHAHWPPSFTERMRVRFAIWRLLIWQEVDQAHSTNFSARLDEWAECLHGRECDTLLRILRAPGSAAGPRPEDGPAIPEPQMLSESERDEMVCVSDTLCAIFGQATNRGTQAGNRRRSSQWSSWTWRSGKVAAGCRALNTILDQAEHDWAWPRDSTIFDYYAPELKYLPQGNAAWRAWKFRLTRQPWSPLAGLDEKDFRIFHKYGLGIWDKERLAGLGYPLETAANEDLTEWDTVQAFRSLVLLELEQSLGQPNGHVEESTGMRRQRKMWNIERGFRGLPLLPISNLTDQVDDVRFNC
jgi:hypothetical protein